MVVVDPHGAVTLQATVDAFDWCERAGARRSAPGVLESGWTRGALSSERTGATVAASVEAVMTIVLAWMMIPLPTLTVPRLQRDAPPATSPTRRDPPPDTPPGSHDAPPVTPPVAPTTPRRVAFAPGVLIDWRLLRVELSAEIVLREGTLELFACSPNTREHESILRVDARPRDIFRAMGLIGLEPGVPVRYDAERDAWHEASGQPVELTVACPGINGGEPVAAREWLKVSRPGASLDALEWVFAGARVFPGGRFGADADGTVVCVVDFDTALIAVRGLHSSSNELLWLEANTPRIPPVGTRCTLLIGAARGVVIVIALSPDGTMRVDDRRVGPADVARLCKAPASRTGGPPPAGWTRGTPPAGRTRDEPRVRIAPAGRVSDETYRRCLAALVAAGVDPGRIDRADTPTGKPPTPPGAPPIPPGAPPTPHP